MMRLEMRFLLAVLLGAAWALAAPGAAPARAQDAPDTTAAVPLEVPSAVEVLDRYLREVGGEEAVRAHASRTVRGTFSLAAQGIRGDLLLYAAAPNRYYLEIDIPGLGLTSTGFDGEVGWIIQPMMGPMLLEDESLEQMKDEADYYELIYDPSEYEVMEVVGSRRLEDRVCWKVRLVRKSGYEAFEYFDRDTGLLVAREGEQESPLGTIEVLTLIREHREFGGVLYPAVLEQELMGMKQVMSFNEVTFDDVPDSAFDLPEEIQVLLEDAPAGESGGNR